MFSRCGIQLTDARDAKKNMHTHHAHKKHRQSNRKEVAFRCVW